MTAPHPHLVFMGTPALAEVVLRALAASNSWQIPLVVAQPDKPAGRGLELEPPPVKKAAIALGLPVVQPASARDPEFLQHLRSVAPDVVVVAAYGQILPPSLLAIPPRGCLNVHTSLLPRWRGAAPIQWALLEGDAQTGVTIMRMDAGLDTGDIIATARTAIEDRDTSATLHHRLADLGADLLTRTLPDWLAGQLTPRPQPAEGITYARKLARADGRIPWEKPAALIDRRIRAFSPWPGAFTGLPAIAGGPAQLKIWDAEPVTDQGSPGEVLAAEGSELVVAAGEGAMRLLSVQREGRRRMDTAQFLKGSPLRPGQILGQEDTLPAPPS